MAKKNSPAKRPKKKRNRYDRVVLWGIIVSAVAVAVLLWGPLHKTKKTAERKQPAQAKKLEQAAREPGTRQEHTGRAREWKRYEKVAVVAIVIDDLGQDLKSAQEVLELPDRVTFAVMPRLPQSKKVAEIARRNRREVLLHLPMEPKNRNGRRPAPGTLRADMTPMEFITALNEDIDSVPGAAGVNNHEGSALTENREAMTFLMSELKSRNLFFLDSFTNSKSIAFAVAGEFGLKAAKRDVFLDSEGYTPAYVRKQLDELSRIAKKHGSAVGIGHPHPATIAELKKWLAGAEEQGIELVPVSYLVK